jgi:hypothetical protein
VADLLHGSRVTELATPVGLKLNDILDSLTRLTVTTLRIAVSYFDYIGSVIEAASNNAHLTSFHFETCDPVKIHYKEKMMALNKNSKLALHFGEIE